MSQQSKITKKRAELLLNNVRQIVKHGIRANLDLCQILHETYVSVIPSVEKSGTWKFVWEVWGYKSWFDFVEIEMGMHELTANAYKKVWQVFGIDLEGAWNMENALPITKMKILAASDKLNKQNVNAWLKKAKGMSCCELQVEIYGENASRTFSVQLTHTDFRAIHRVLDSKRKQFGEELTNGQVLMQLLSPYSAQLRKAS